MLTEETRKKISNALKGKMPKFIPNNKGRVRTEEHKRKISEALKRKGIKPPRPPRSCLKRGCEHPQWRGGVASLNDRLRKSPEFREWREAVFKRDNYTCVFCGSRGGNGYKVILHPDHIKPFALYPESRFDIDNGRTLCASCHRKTETYGKNCWGNEV